jgi:alpha-ribazole phosphatase
MAEAAAVRCARARWAAIYASPLLRTRQTAEAVARRVGLSVQLEPAFREIEYGEWDGRPAAEIRATDRARYEAWVARPAEVAPPGGETAAAIAARAVPALEAVVRRHPEGRVLVVSHKATIRVLVCALLGVDLNLFRVRVGAPVASVTAIEFRSTGPLLAHLGDTSHLPEHLQGLEGT